MRRHKRLRQELCNPANGRWRFQRFIDRTLIAANGEKTFVMSHKFWRLLDTGGTEPRVLDLTHPRTNDCEDRKGTLGLGQGALAEFMDLDRGTATRLMSKGESLPSHAAETLLRLQEIHDMSNDVFATEQGASTWLRTPHPLLDGERPLDSAKTSYGAQTVKNLLMSTKYGGVA